MVDKSMGAALRFFEKVGHRINNAVQRLGFAARFFVMVLVYSGQSFRRFHLTIREIYFSGFQSLLIILVSGLFIGMVLGMQGYETLQRYGSSEALGVLVALSLTRELGPVVAALLFASRAGSSITAEIGLMKATEQLTAMDMMAVNPIARVVAPRFWGGVISMPLLAALFSAIGVFGGYLIGVAVAFFATRTGLPAELRLFVVTGFLGGLATFSTFSAEVVYLLQRQQLGWGLVTIGQHLGGSLSMTALGWWTWRALRHLT